jgi:hypothetical protein
MGGRRQLVRGQAFQTDQQELPPKPRCWVLPLDLRTQNMVSGQVLQRPFVCAASAYRPITCHVSYLTESRTPHSSPHITIPTPYHSIHDLPYLLDAATTASHITPQDSPEPRLPCKHTTCHKAENQRKGKSPNSRVEKTESNQNHWNSTTAPSPKCSTYSCDLESRRRPEIQTHAWCSCTAYTTVCPATVHAAVLSADGKVCCMKASADAVHMQGGGKDVSFTAQGWHH